MALLDLVPFSLPEDLPQGPVDTATIITLITSHFIFLATCVHIDIEALHFPPENGWPSIGESDQPGIDEKTLRERGRSDKAIFVLKHLPHFQRWQNPTDPLADRSVFLTPETFSIAYHAGEVWGESLHSRCPTPGDVVWLGQAAHWDAPSLLLDVAAGTITEWPGRTALSTMAEVNALSPEDRWMAYRTRSIKTYCHEARRYYERFMWIPRPGPSFINRKGGGWLIEQRIGNQLVEEYASEDEDYQDEPNASDDEVSSLGTADSDDNSRKGMDSRKLTLETDKEDISGGAEIPEDEITELMQDSGSHGTVSTPQNGPRVLTRSVNRPPPQRDDDMPDWLMKQEQRCQKLKEIYLRHQWPSEAFDKSGCRNELLEWYNTEQAREKEASKLKREKGKAQIRGE